jgi:hypothetical protein
VAGGDGIDSHLWLGARGECTGKGCVRWEGGREGGKVGGREEGRKGGRGWRTRGILRLVFIMD